jgi:hypothetical protein
MQEGLQRLTMASCHTIAIISAHLILMCYKELWLGFLQSWFSFGHSEVCLYIFGYRYLEAKTKAPQVEDLDFSTKHIMKGPSGLRCFMVSIRVSRGSIMFT